MTFEMNGIDNPNDFRTGKTSIQDSVGGIVRKYKAVAGHLSCDLNGEAVILNMKNGKYYGVNSVGASIWAAIQVPISFGDILSALLAEYEVDEEICRQSIATFLEKMAREGLIEVFDE